MFLYCKCPKSVCVTENRRLIDVSFSNYPPPSYFPVSCPRCRGVETNSSVKYWGGTGGEHEAILRSFSKIDWVATEDNKNSRKHLYSLECFFSQKYRMKVLWLWHLLSSSYHINCPVSKPVIFISILTCPWMWKNYLYCIAIS